MSEQLERGWEIKFFQSPNEIFDVPDLSEHAKIVYLYLCRCADTQKTAFPSKERIAKKVSTSVSTVKRTLKELADRGLLIVEPRKKQDGSDTSNLYRLIHPTNIQAEGYHTEPLGVCPTK